MSDVIVLVDDEEMVLRALSRVLKGAGMTVWATTQPRQALEYLMTQPQPLAVISDHHMPDMTGLELLAEASVYAPYAARLLTTGSPSKQMLADAINRSHVHFYVEKPVSMPHLLELLGRVKARHERQQPPPPKPVKAPGVRGDELYDAARYLSEGLLPHIKART
jgi:CheY-like chemotaxis protein